MGNNGEKKFDPLAQIPGHPGVTEYDLMMLNRDRYLEDKFGKLTEEDVIKIQANMKRHDMKS